MVLKFDFMLEIKNLTKEYTVARGGKVEALRGVSFAFPGSGMVFVVGKSGSGKSSLLNILGMLDDYDGGEYLINGRSSRDFTGAERDAFRAVNIGFVFQEFHIIDKYTIGQNVSLPMEIQKNEDRGKVAEILKKVGLPEYENRRPSQLSGGQRQRVAIARAIVKNPQIVLADEPTGSLDSVTGREIFDILKEISTDRLVIVISHDLESANRYADKIVELKDGAVERVYDGDGGAESVELTVDKITPAVAKKIEKLADGGKKVIVKRRAKVPPVTAEPSNTLSIENKTAKLPFKSVLKLSFFSMRSKWARTLFTVLIAALSVAFFGFADIVARYNINDIIVQELARENLGFTEIGMERVDENGIIKIYTSTDMLDGHIAEFNKLGLTAYPRRAFDAQLPMGLKNYQFVFPPEDAQYYHPRSKDYTEVDDFSKLGLKLIAGRAPNLNTPNVLEVAITTYHMECYKLFGFRNGDVSYDSVADFSQIEGKFFHARWAGVFNRVGYKIVGLVEVDTSRYQDLADIKTPAANVTRALETRVAEFDADYRRYIGNLYVPAGFHAKSFDYFGANHLEHNKYTFGENAVPRDFNMMRINGKEFGDVRIHFKNGITDESHLGDNQIILEASVLGGLFPEMAALTDPGAKLDYFDTNIAGQKITFETSSPQIWTHKPITAELEIIGVLAENELNYSLVSQNVADMAKVTAALGFKVPTADNAARRAVADKISADGAFSLNGDDAFAFFCNASGYSQLRRLDMLFTLFVGVFSIIAAVLCAFTILLTYFFISQSIALRKKDIGILRSLGARKTDVANIFIAEGVFIAAAEIILGALVCFGAFKILNTYFVEQIGQMARIYTLIRFSVRQVLLIAAVTISAVAASLTFPIWRIAKKQPVETIRNA